MTPTPLGCFSLPKIAFPYPAYHWGMKRTKSEAREEAKLALELADIFHEHGISLPTRTIYVGAEDDGVAADMAARFLKNLHILESMSHDPIRVLWDCPGGDVYHGLAMYDAITQCPCEVTVVVRGHAMSMGSIVLQAADHRVMGPHATQMLHYGGAGFDGEAKTFVRWAEEEKRLDALIEQIYLKRIREKIPDFDLKELQAFLDRDSFFTAERSVFVGLADEIG